jgi:hypothetical protein
MMATSVIGTLPEFNPEEQDTASYLEKVELFFEANNIAEEKKVAVFLTAAGQKYMRSCVITLHQNYQGKRVSKK